MMEIPFDVSFHFDENLHEIPNNAPQMQQALEFLQSQLDREAIDPKHRIYLLGRIGVYARILLELSTAQKALTSALEISESLGDERLRVVNLIRLAHLYQWQQKYTLAEELFEQAIARCQSHPELHTYLDFAYQHMGKCKFDQKQYAAAQYYFEQALSLRLKKADPSLINSTQLALNTVNLRSSL